MIRISEVVVCRPFYDPDDSWLVVGCGQSEEASDSLIRLSWNQWAVEMLWVVGSFMSLVTV